MRWLLLALARVRAACASSSQGPVVINEVLPRAADGNGEWIELRNAAAAPVDLSGWRLQDRADNTLGSLQGSVIAPGAYLAVDFSAKLNNNGDAVTLYDDSGGVADMFEYTATVPGMSFARLPDGGKWEHKPREPTKAASNVPCEQQGAVINEVMPNPDSGDEWVELYNVGCTDIDMAGWKLVDKAGNAREWDARVLPARSYLVVYFGSRLNDGGDSLELVSGSGATEDSFSYGSSTAGKSWQRLRGAGPWSPEPLEPTGGRPNRAASEEPPATAAPSPAPQPAPGRQEGPPPCGGSCGGICFGTWNIQNLGPSKGGRPAVMAVIKQVLSRYDVVGIQELSQMPREPFAWCGENTEDVICDSIPDRDAFAVRASPRIGDEQYVVMYKKASADIPEAGATYPDHDGIHARPPHAFEVLARRGSAGRFVVAVTHTRPDRAEEEIHGFPRVTSWMEQEFSGAQHFLLAGDFNADGSYFSDEREWPDSQLQSYWGGYVQLTDNSMDSTVASNDNTYDRIVVDRGLGEISGRASVYRLENIDLTAVLKEGCEMGYVPASLCDDESLAGVAWEDMPGSARTALAQEISDHHPVEVCLGYSMPNWFVAIG